ncbi:MAG: septal ring lytic transglycosylase RlpA family protein, partial [Pseudomonadota bacterium]|nr:septal ring lytic transglycosylase RlpA family protein [Pseudomonadota bacterium]
MKMLGPARHPGIVCFAALRSAHRQGAADQAVLKPRRDDVAEVGRPAGAAHGLVARSRVAGGVARSLHEGHRPHQSHQRRRHERHAPADSLWRCAFVTLVLGALLSGCASGPRRGVDGPGVNPPANLAALPDAEPRLEPIRPGGANKPYQALGRDYVPMTRDTAFTEHGLASWYGRQFHGRRTASGEIYDMYAMTAAHPTLPIPSYARIRNPANGREVIVRINDRGPFHAGRIVDLSYAAALRLDLLRGVAPVELERLTFDDIRAGLWRSGGVPVLATLPVPSLPLVAAEPAAAAAPA